MSFLCPPFLTPSFFVLLLNYLSFFHLNQPSTTFIKINDEVSQLLKDNCRLEICMSDEGGGDDLLGTHNQNKQLFNPVFHITLSHPHRDHRQTSWRNWFTWFWTTPSASSWKCSLNWQAELKTTRNFFLPSLRRSLSCFHPIFIDWKNMGSWAWSFTRSSCSCLICI